MPELNTIAERSLYRAQGLPIFQNRTFGSRAEARNCATGDVQLVQSSQTGLIRNNAFRAEQLTYDSDYHNEQNLSSVFRQHMVAVADIVGRHFYGYSLIEVGCGKAHFLEMLQAKNYSIMGMDPAYEGTNPSVRKQYFSSEAGFKADGIILRHVLEHVENPVSFLQQISEANGQKGKIYIEVPCFDWICRRRAWFDIFYEHVNYFRLSDFERIFGTVHEAGHIFEGQYLYAVADLSTVRIPRQAATNVIEFPKDFIASVDQVAKKLKATRAPVVVWGAASKGVIFSLFMERLGARIDMAIDINPAKQNRFLPVTGLYVEPPRIIDSFPSETQILVMNGNYLEEVKALAGNRFNYLAVDDERT